MTDQLDSDKVWQKLLKKTVFLDVESKRLIPGYETTLQVNKQSKLLLD